MSNTLNSSAPYLSHYRLLEDSQPVDLSCSLSRYLTRRAPNGIFMSIRISYVQFRGIRRIPRRAQGHSGTYATSHHA